MFLSTLCLCSDSLNFISLQRARQPRFPVGIQPRTFELVQDILRKLQYSGPVALSCDNTKLLASFRPFYDEDRKGYFVMGHTGDPYELVDHQAFQRVVERQELTKATKVNYFTKHFHIFSRGLSRF